MYTKQQAISDVEKYNKKYPPTTLGECTISGVPGVGNYNSSPNRCKINIKRDGKWTTTTYTRVVALAAGLMTEDQFADSAIQICHSCDIPNCIKTAHLWIGDNLENQYDSIRKGRHTGTNRMYCINGHPLSGANLYIRPDLRRACRTCREEASKRYKNKSWGILAGTSQF